LIWVSWRTQKVQLITAGLVFAAFVVWLAVTGILYHHAYFNPSSCAYSSAGFNTCSDQPNYDALLSIVDVNQYLLLLLPAALGIILGAPVIAREIEQRSNRFAWTQDVTRARWTVAKLLLPAVAIAAAIGATAPLLDWWNRVADITGESLMDPKFFGVSGIVPAGFALLAFFVAAFIGAIIRRPGWTVATSVPVVTAMGWAMYYKLRPNLLSPVVATFRTADQYSFETYPSTGARPSVFGWFFNSGYVPIGRTTPAPGQNWNTGWNEMLNCESSNNVLTTYKNNTDAADIHCQAVTHLHFVLLYQPFSHFWQLQLVETGVYVVAAAVLFGLCMLGMRRFSA
jgi:hypothetical protein